MKKLYVGNLPYSATTEGISEFLKNLFPEMELNFGEVTIIMDRETGRSKGFGFVEINDDEQANAIIAKFEDEAFKGSPEAQMDGRPLNINEARPREERPAGGFRGGNRGGYNGGNRGGDRGGNSWN